MIIAVTLGDPFAATALRVAETLARQDDAGELITLDATESISAIARLADRQAAALVIVPAPNAGATERVGSAGRAARIAAVTSQPVLLIPISAPWPSRRCVLALDFGSASIAAALAAFALLERPAVAAAAFVDTGGGVAPSDSDGVPPPHVRLLFDALPAALGSHPGVAITPHFLKGERVPALIGFATTYGADLLAIGRQGRSASGLPLTGQLGPTVRGLLEQSPCSVLVSSGV